MRQQGPRCDRKTWLPILEAGQNYMVAEDRGMVEGRVVSILEVNTIRVGLAESWV